MSEDTPQLAAPQPTPDWQHDPQESPAPQLHGDAYSENTDEPTVVWSAAEFVAHNKDMRWYLSVVAATIALATIIRLLTRDNISTAMVVIVGIVFCIAATRKPRMLTYSVNTEGIVIGERFMPYGEFRSFSIVRDGQIANLELVPMKRFMPLTSIYCSPETEEDAVEMISHFIPYEEHRHNFVDVIASRIHF